MRYTRCSSDHAVEATHGAKTMLTINITNTNTNTRHVKHPAKTAKNQSVAHMGKLLY
jgi:hypothetical protein